MQMTLSRSQLTLDSAGFVTADGRPLNLPPKERAVLALLLARQPHVVSKSEFAAAAWGRQLMSDESLARSISRLRRALSPFGLLISSVYGSGYRLSGDEPPPFQTNPPGACRSAQQRAQQRTLAGLGRAMAPLRRQLEQEPGVATARVLAAEGRAAGGCGWVGAAPHRATNDAQRVRCWRAGACAPFEQGMTVSTAIGDRGLVVDEHRNDHRCRSSHPDAGPSLDLNVAITIAFEMTGAVIHARALLNLASGDIEGLAFDGHDAAVDGQPWRRKDYGFAAGTLSSHGRAVEFKVDVNGAGQLSVSASELLDLKTRATVLFAGKPPGR